MDKFNGIDMSVWQGRQDPEDGELALRWHDRVQPWQENREPGVVLLGFACDEGVRRNKGRVGAAGAPLAVRKLLARAMGIAPSRLTLVGGATARDKLFRVD